MTLEAIDPTGRFSDRVEHYIRSRPGYPDAAIDTLASEAGLVGGSIIADIGSGTGILSERLLDRGWTVHAVEPNRAMREAAEQRLASSPAFHSVDGSAESTGLASGTVDLICAAQAFHWFEPGPAREEFERILHPEGRVALLWNTWESSTPFLRDYEKLVQSFGTDFSRVDHRHIGAERIRAFLTAEYHRYTFPNEQVFDFEGLRSRLLSSSYVPAPGQPGHEAMLSALEEIFEAHQRDGHVRFPYTTGLHLGKL